MLPSLSRTMAFVAAALLVFAPLAARAQDPNLIGEFKLREGLAVVTSEVPTSRQVVIDTWVRAGSIDDFVGMDGIAAVTARMLWQGGEAGLETQIKKLGGDGEVEIDAETTHFQVRLPANKLEAGLNLVGQVLGSPDWTHLAIAPAVEAVREKEGALDKPQVAAAIEALTNHMLGVRFGHEVAGQSETRVALTPSDIQAFFERHYLPARMRVVLAGNVDTGKAVGMVVRSYAATLKHTAPTAAAPARLAVAPRTSVGATVVAAGVMGAVVWEPRNQAALEMLLHVAKARTMASLQEPEYASLVVAHWTRMTGRSPLAVYVSVKDGAVNAVRDGLKNTYADLRTNLVSLDEHAKALTAVAQANSLEHANLAKRARVLGFAATIPNDPKWARTYPEIVRQVTRQDMMEVAQKYMAEDAVRVFTFH